MLKISDNAATYFTLSRINIILDQKSAPGHGGCWLKNAQIGRRTVFDRVVGRA